MTKMNLPGLAQSLPGASIKLFKFNYLTSESGGLALLPVQGKGQDRENVLIFNTLRLARLAPLKGRRPRVTRRPLRACGGERNPSMNGHSVCREKLKRTY